MRKAIAILFILAILSVISSNLYGMLAYVSDVDTENNMVRFTSYLSEHDFWIEGVEDWELYDDAELVMFDWFTESWTDDQILRATYFRWEDLPKSYVRGEN